MNQTTRPQGGWVIWTTLFIGLIFTIFPFPEWANEFRPPWVSLLIIYWAMAVPNKVGIMSAWFAGLSIDIIAGGLMGQHAMGLSIVVFLVVQLHLRLRLFPMWQQSVAVCILLLIEQLVNLWITSIAYGPKLTLAFWYPLLVSLFLWPWVFIILRDVRRRFHIN